MDRGTPLRPSTDALWRAGCDRTRRPLLIAVFGIVAGTAACDGDGDGCGGATCPFPPPSHHAVVRGTVVDLNDHPLAGIHSRVSFEHQVYSGVGTQTNSEGRFQVTARAELSRDTTIAAWVHASQANPPPAAVIRDSVAVQLRFTARTEVPQALDVRIQLAVTP